MRPLFNTVFVTTEGAWLRKDGENLVMELEKVEKARGELRGRIAERRAAGEEISSEEEEDMVVHAGHVIRTPGRHLGTAAQPHRKNRKKK